MSVNIHELRSRLGEMNNVAEKFLTLSRESDSKLGNIMETAKSLQDRMEPLNKNMEQLQTRRKNLEFCRTELVSAQGHYRAGKDVDSIIFNGPTGVLDRYLPAMDKVKAALYYFKENNPEHVEYCRLQALHQNGREALEKEFAGILKQNFPAINGELLLRLLLPEENDPDPVTLNDLEVVPESVIYDLIRISHWLMQDTGPGGDLPSSRRGGNCVAQYCVYRMENLRNTLKGLTEYKNNPNNIMSVSSSPMPQRAKTAQSTLQNRQIRRRPTSTKKGINTREAGHKKTTDIREESDDVEVDVYTLCLNALVKLMQNERHWLDRLELAPTMSDKCGALDSIIKGASNDILSDGGKLVRMMTRAQARHDYQAVLSLIAVLKRFEDIKPELTNVLKYTMESTVQSFQNLIGNLQQHCRTSLEVYEEFIKSQTQQAVPSDGTVHEHTTNTLIFLEKLTGLGDLVGNILLNDGASGASVLHHQPAASVHPLFERTTSLDAQSPRRSLGHYFIKVITSLMKNIERKSEYYADNVILKYVFQINNFHYIWKTVQETGLKEIVLSYNVDFMSDTHLNIQNKKITYVQSCAKLLEIPDGNSLATASQNHGRNVSQWGKVKMDSKEKAHIKDLWNCFNNGLSSLVKNHRSYSMPDRELREALLRELRYRIVPRYRGFRDHYLSVPFTGKRDKFIRVTPEELDTKLAHFFVEAEK